MIKYYLSKKYVGKLKELEKHAWEKKSIEKIESVKRVSDFLNNGFRINTDLENSDLERIVSDSLTGVCRNEVDRLLLSAMRKDFLLPCNFNFSQVNAQDIYLVDVDVNYPFNSGVISSIDPSDFSKRLKLWKSSITEIKKNDDYSGLVFAPSNALIIMDPYLIQEKKMNKFMGFLENFIANKISNSYHLSIYSNIDYSNENSIMELQNRFDKLANLKYEIILVNNIFTSNRIFISNYNFGTFSHPFDRDDIMSVSFVPSDVNALEMFTAAKNYVSQFVRQTNYYSIVGSVVQKIYRNEPGFVNRLVSELCPRGDMSPPNNAI